MIKLVHGNKNRQCNELLDIFLFSVLIRLFILYSMWVIYQFDGHKTNKRCGKLFKRMFANRTIIGPPRTTTVIICPCTSIPESILAKKAVPITHKLHCATVRMEYSLSIL